MGAALSGTMNATGRIGISVSMRRFTKNKDTRVQVYETIARELGITPKQVTAVAGLLDEGATIPFIARYRKEAHGSLDEVAVGAVRDRLRTARPPASVSTFS